MTAHTVFFVVESLARKEMAFSHCHHAAICSKACFCLPLHTLSPLPVALSPSLGIRWWLVGLASCAVFVHLLGRFCRRLHTWSLVSFFWDLFVFILGSFLNLASFRDHLEITLGSVMGHFVIIVCTWHSPGIILEFLWGHLLLFWDQFGFGVISWSSGGHFGIILGSF